MVSGVPELEVGLELLFYVGELLVVLRGIIQSRNRLRALARRVDAIFPKFKFAPC